MYSLNKLPNATSQPSSLGVVLLPGLMMPAHGRRRDTTGKISEGRRKRQQRRGKHKYKKPQFHRKGSEEVYLRDCQLLIPPQPAKE